MDMSLRFIYPGDPLELLKAHSKETEALPGLQEVFFLPASATDVRVQIEFGFVRLRLLDHESVELSVNRKIYRKLGYEHQKYVIFIGPKEVGMYLISALGLTEIGTIEQFSQIFKPDIVKNDFRFLFSVSSANGKKVETVKVEGETEDDLLQGLRFLGLSPDDIEEIDPILQLLT